MGAGVEVGGGGLRRLRWTCRPEWAELLRTSLGDRGLATPGAADLRS